MGIAQEMISYSQGQTSYKVKVKSFKHKMLNWNSGRVIRLKSFKVDGIRLQMLVYPNGNSLEAQDYVSIYIYNLTDFGITILLDLYLGDQKFIDRTFAMSKKTNRGYPKFFHHSYRNMQEDDDESFEITLTVKRLYREVLADDVEGHDVIQSIDRMEKKLSSRIESNYDEMKQKIEKLEKNMKNLTMRENANVTNGGPKIPYPECPICLEDITQNSRIMQCSAGHLICGGCHDQLVGKFCPSCKKPIIGRCHGMETYLRSLFPEKKKPATNNNDRVYQCYGATIRCL